MGHIVFAMIRAIYLSFAVMINEPTYDIYFTDQISIYVFLLKFFKSQSKVVFYCHHPDLLLTTNHNLLNRIYRIPFNLIEEFTTSVSDILLCNSLYSQSIIRKTFTKFMNEDNTEISILYPSLNTTVLDVLLKKCIEEKGVVKDDEYVTFMSINRYERKKNISLAIKSFIKMKENMLKNERIKNEKIKLVISGGYDNMVNENIEYYNELIDILKSESNRINIILTEEAEINNLKIFENKENNIRIEFYKSPSDEKKIELFIKSSVILYTPSFEHFGIVPVEGMYCGRSIIGMNSGGPKETIINEKTGFLIDEEDDESVKVNNVGKCMLKYVEDKDLSSKLGDNCKKHVKEDFSFEKFKNELKKYVLENDKRNSNEVKIALCRFIFLVLLFLLCYIFH